MKAEDINHEQKIVIKGSLFLNAIGILSFIPIIPINPENKISVWSFAIPSLYTATGILGTQINKKQFNVVTILYGQVSIIILKLINFIIGILKILKADKGKLDGINKEYNSIIGWLWTIASFVILIFMIYLLKISCKCGNNN
ncbi:hypothetical protein SteCoe_18423 [Stentor coeruleus]|uniref:Uncharacterized protein n=1 Tax=Stentor coeruleus TaxID=5963 RepID=A0A1R2BWY7_9CILI|nr:hypothetical protein SteCoe_18423 [Stentor coeruleus]